MKHSGVAGIKVAGMVWAAGVAIIAAAPSVGVAQAKAATVPDAQIESDVLRALAGNAKLADQTITSNTVYGTVTLSGSVRSEESRRLAETVVSQTPGVRKVIDELTLGTDANATTQKSEDPAQAADNTGSNPLLQSDGTMAQPSSQTAAGQNPPAEQQTPSVQQQPQATQQQRPPYDQQPPYNRQPYGRPGSDRSGAQGDGGYQASQPPAGPYGPPYRGPYRQPPSGPPPGYQQQPNGYQQAPYASQVPYGAQPGGQPVTIPSGAMLRVRINQGLDSKHTQPGTIFDAVVLNDVVADNFVAVPRGATVKGTVVDSQSAGTLKGRGELALQLTEVVLAGRAYPIVSDTWSKHGGDKTVRTVDSALGLGAVGAVIGGVAGGGAGAAIGAGVGGAAGVGASAISDSGKAYIPAEAILIFHLKQGTALATVSQAEMDRLGYGVAVGGQMRRRYVQPVPYGYPVPYRRYPYPYPY